MVLWTGSISYNIMQVPIYQHVMWLVLLSKWKTICAPANIGHCRWRVYFVSDRSYKSHTLKPSLKSKPVCMSWKDIT